MKTLFTKQWGLVAFLTLILNTGAAFAAVLNIETRANGVEADSPPGPTVALGSSVNWSFDVTNSSFYVVYGISLTDSLGTSITCPADALYAGQSMTCQSISPANVCQGSNLGTVVGTYGKGQDANASDLAYYSVVGAGAITIKKYVNGEDADTAPGPQIAVGAPLQYTFHVTNTGVTQITGISITDNTSLVAVCPKTVLEPGESMTCTASATATAGQHENIATVHGSVTCGSVSASDPAHYFGVVGSEGCTPGYWKNHTDSWPPTGYSSGQTLLSVFSNASSYPTLSSSTLLQALGFAGGPGLEGGAEILFRAAVAALLNSAHPGVDYPRTSASVIADVNAALATLNRDALLLLAASLDADNNLGCPLNRR